MIDYEASQFAMDQLRCVCTRLEEDIMKIDKSKGMDVYIDSLQQLNETNEKVEYWTLKCAEQQNMKNLCLEKVKTTYKKYKKIYTKCLPKSSFNGMEYFSKKLYFLKCIQKVKIEIEKLKIMSTKINNEYNKTLLRTEDLAKNLKNESIIETNYINSDTFSFNFICNKINDVQKTVSNVCSSIIKLFDFTQESSSVYSVDNSFSSEYETPNTSFLLNSDQLSLKKFSDEINQFSNLSQNYNIESLNSNSQFTDINDKNDKKEFFFSLQNVNSTNINSSISEYNIDFENHDLQTLNNEQNNHVTLLSNHDEQIQKNDNENAFYVNNTNFIHKNNLSLNVDNNKSIQSSMVTTPIKPKTDSHKRSKSYFTFLNSTSFDLTNFNVFLL